MVLFLLGTYFTAPFIIPFVQRFLSFAEGAMMYVVVEELDEAGALRDISHMPARVKCAVLGWHTMEELLK